MPPFTFAEAREATALGAVLFVFLLTGWAGYKIVLPKFFSHLESMQRSNTDAIEKVHGKVDATLREVTLEMREAMHEAINTSRQIAKDSQEFTLKVLDQVSRDQKEQKKEKQNVS
jgi:hypothetical protein